MDDKAYILAMYDIRGKQEFIYKSSKIKEIMGGSYLIRDCFKDCLFPAAKKCPGKGIFHYKQEAVGERECRFSEENFRRRLEAGYIGEVMYDGGGNFFVLYRDVAVYRAVNRIFYRKLLDYAYSLRVLTTYIDQIDFSEQDPFYQSEASQAAFRLERVLYRKAADHRSSCRSSFREYCILSEETGSGWGRLVLDL